MNVLQVISVVCLFNSPVALLLDDGGQSDIQHLHQLLAEEKQQRLELEHRVNVIEETQCGCTKDVSVSFMAQMSATLNNPANGHVIVFDDVLTNVGSAYNNVHGIFTAPVNGTYFFNLVASSLPASTAHHSLHLHIIKDKQQVAYIFLDRNTAFSLRRTTSSLLHLTRGSEIWVEVAGVVGPHALIGCCFHTHLQGFLIQAD